MTSSSDAQDSDILRRFTALGFDSVEAVQLLDETAHFCNGLDGVRVQYKGDMALYAEIKMKSGTAMIVRSGDWIVRRAGTTGPYRLWTTMTLLKRYHLEEKNDD